MNVLLQYLLLAVLTLTPVAPRADGIWNNNSNSISGRDGLNGDLAAGAPPPPPLPCSTPNAPDGTLDMSKCSNAVWAAVLF